MLENPIRKKFNNDVLDATHKAQKSTPFEVIMAKKTKDKKQEVNEKHIELYDKTLSLLEFLLNEFSHDIKYAEFEFLEVPKNTIATIDFIISAIGKVQKGQRVALGLDNDIAINEEPEINIIEGLSGDKI